MLEKQIGIKRESGKVGTRARGASAGKRRSGGGGQAVFKGMASALGIEEALATANTFSSPAPVAATVTELIAAHGLAMLAGINSGSHLPISGAPRRGRRGRGRR